MLGWKRRAEQARGEQATRKAGKKSGNKAKNLLTSVLEFSILATRKTSLQKLKFHLAQLNINFLAFQVAKVLQSAADLDGQGLMVA